MRIVYFLLMFFISLNCYANYSTRIVKYVLNYKGSEIVDIFDVYKNMSLTILTEGTNETIRIDDWKIKNVPIPTLNNLPSEEESLDIYQIIENNRQNAKSIELKTTENDYLQFCFNYGFTNKATVEDWKTYGLSLSNKMEALSILMEAQGLIQNVQVTSGRADAFYDIPNTLHPMDKAKKTIYFNK